MYAIDADFSVRIVNERIDNMYTERDRLNDFNYFVENYKELFRIYGHKFFAIKNNTVLGTFDSIPEAINCLSDKYQVGNYIIQECTGDESAYKTTIMRLMIKG